MQGDGKASPGDRFQLPKAEVWNSMVDAGNAYRNSQLGTNTPDRTRPRSTDIIKVKNVCGANRSRGEILRFDGSALTQLAAESICLLGNTPTDEDYFGILKKPCANNDLVETQVSGCCIALVDIVDENHTRAKAVEGEYVLESSDCGPIEILFKPELESSSEAIERHECVVRFSHASTCDETSGSSSSSYSSSSSGSSSSGSRSSGSRSSNSSSGSISGSSSSSSSSSSSGSDSESDKSTAIVPASFTPGGYTALFTMEAPEVRFDDVITCKAVEKITRVQIDPRFVEVCHKNTIVVDSVTCSRLSRIAANIIDGFVEVELDEVFNPPATITIRLTGVRRGFLGKRFPNRTREQFLANEKTLRSAYPGAGK